MTGYEILNFYRSERDWLSFFTKDENDFKEFLRHYEITKQILNIANEGTTTPYTPKVCKMLKDHYIRAKEIVDRNRGYTSPNK